MEHHMLNVDRQIEDQNGNDHFTPSWPLNLMQYSPAPRPYRFSSCILDTEGLDSGVECCRFDSQQRRSPIGSVDLAVTFRQRGLDVCGFQRSQFGVVGQSTAPELRAQALLRDRFIGVVRMGHPLSQGEVTPSRYAAGRHVYVSRQGVDKGPIDEALRAVGLERKIVTIVGGFSTSLALARASDLIASVPERHTGNLREGMHSFPLPVSTPEITISLLWHPRLDADPAHRWLRGHVRHVCAALR